MFCNWRILIVAFFVIFSAGCATSPKAQSELAQGKRYFETGYYKRAFKLMLPLAAEGNKEAEYAVGYLYYYGYGVTPDTDTGYFWIKKSADQGYPPAEQAIQLLNKPAPKKIDQPKKLP